MVKNLHCARCGKELLHLRKAVKGNLFDLVEPHECTKLHEPTITDKTVPTTHNKENLNELFDSFKFVKKIDSLKTVPTGDNRSEDILRKEKSPLIASSAPSSLLDMVKGK